MTPQQTARKALDNYKQDNLERAQHAFGGMTDKQMSEQHGLSGRTRREVLDGYIRDRREWQAASEWLDKMIAATDSK